MRAQICLRVRMNDNYIIPLNGLASGKSSFFWHAGKEFFDGFENDEIRDAGLEIEVTVEKSGRYLGVDCDIDGNVTVECDRCLEDVVLPVDAHVALSVKYGEESESGDHQEGDREIVFVAEDAAELDMAQVIYDYVCLSLPMQRVHEPGQCNPDAMKYFGSSERQDDVAEEEDVNPFAALKDMFR